jgi:drug/metabolite transporter (DMT)-like permease
LLLLALVVLWGSAFGLTDRALTDFSPLQVVTGRLWIGALVLLVTMGSPRGWFPKDRRSWLFLIAMSVFGNVLPFFLISWGQQTVPSGMTGILMAVMPLVVLVLAHFLVPGERMDRFKVAGFGFGFSGIALLTGPAALVGAGGAAELVAQLSVLGGAVCYGLNLIIARRSPPMRAQMAAGCVLLISAVLSTLSSVAAGESMPAGAAPVPLLSLLSLGLLSTGLATVIYYRIVARAGATFLSLINYLIPVYAVLAGTVVLDERLEPRAVVALVVILAGLVLSNRKPGGRSR